EPKLRSNRGDRGLADAHFFQDAKRDRDAASTRYRHSVPSIALAPRDAVLPVVTGCIAQGEQAAAFEEQRFAAAVGRLAKLHDARCEQAQRDDRAIERAIILVEGDSLARLVLVYKHLVEARVGYPLPLETIQKEASPARDRSNCLCGILLAIAGSI